jgi:hypothetical protein
MRVLQPHLDDQPRYPEADTLMANQKLLAWSLGLGVAGFIGMGISNSSSTSTGGSTNTPTGSSATTTPYDSYPTYEPAPAYSAPVYTPPPAPEQAQPLVCGVNLDCGSVDTPERVVPTPEQIVSAPEEHTYYKSCAAARAGGVAPLHQGDAGYRSGLDRDGDGIACE